MQISIPLSRRFLPILLFTLSAAGVARSQYPLDSWVQRQVAGSISGLSSVAFGNGVFVAVGAGSGVARSTNGADWTATSAGSYGDFYRIRFLNGEFVTVGSSDRILTSPDGVTWTATIAPIAGGTDIAFGNGAYVMTSNGSSYYSTNGVNWSPTFPSVEGLSLVGLDTVVYNKGRFIAIPTYPIPGLIPAQTLHSTNGIDWVGTSGFVIYPPGPGLGEILCTDNLVLGTVDTTNLRGMLTSTNNGSSWCCLFSGHSTATRGGAALAYGEGHYLYVHHTTPNMFIYSSTNGLSWVNRSASSGWKPRSAAFGHGSFVVVGATDDSAQPYVLQSGTLSGVPTIFEEPTDRSAVVGNPALFNVQAVGAPPLSYQWYRDGAAIAGATNTSYSIGQVATADVAGYHVVIANSFGSVTSRVARLTVGFLEIDSYAGIKILGVPGRTYRIEATPTSGSPNWHTLTNVILPSSSYIWIDYESPAVPTRLYRAAELP